MADKSNEFAVALGECFNALDDAFWAASSMETKDRIVGCMRHVAEMRDVMMLQDMDARSTAFAKAAERIAAGNKRLEKLKEDIDDLINKVDAITNVIGTIGKVLSLKSFIPGLSAII